MSSSQSDEVWDLVVSLQGAQFETKTGKPFTYEVRGNVINPSRTEYNIPRSDLEKVIDIGPPDGPGQVSNTVRGSAYIWGILHDDRVRNVAWPEALG